MSPAAGSRRGDPGPEDHPVGRADRPRPPRAGRRPCRGAGACSGRTGGPEAQQRQRLASIDLHPPRSLSAVRTQARGHDDRNMTSRCPPSPRPSSEPPCTTPNGPRSTVEAVDWPAAGETRTVRLPAFVLALVQVGPGATLRAGPPTTWSQDLARPRSDFTVARRLPASRTSAIGSRVEAARMRPERRQGRPRWPISRRRLRPDGPVAAGDLPTLARSRRRARPSPRPAAAHPAHRCSSRTRT